MSIVLRVYILSAESTYDLGLWAATANWMKFDALLASDARELTPGFETTTDVLSWLGIWLLEHANTTLPRQADECRQWPPTACENLRLAGIHVIACASKSGAADFLRRPGRFVEADAVLTPETIAESSHEQLGGKRAAEEMFACLEFLQRGFQELRDDRDRALALYEA